ncbi:MAG: Rrf2 family transcriptional regulator [Clostridium sp.]
MKISTKGRYGLRALIDLKMNCDRENVTIKVISERQEISERYLEQIFSSLRKAGIIIGRKGAQGGYVLNKEASKLTILEILHALEGDSLLIDINLEDKNELESFVNNNLWKGINDKINDYFESITLQDLVNDYKESKGELLYYI